MASFIMFFSIISIAPVFCAQTDWQVYQRLELDYEPVDILVAQHDRRVYILSDQGEIAIYTFNGQLKGKLMVGTDVQRIEAGPSQDMLFLVRPKSRVVESILITLTEKIDIQGSPVKGAADAPVVLAVFSDFQ
jgi:hypothetical protein